MINTLVPTAVFNSYPKMPVRRSSIIIPPPAPIKPQINPTAIPLIRDWIKRFLALTEVMDSLVVITGFRINLMPRNSVINTEKPPIAAFGTRLAVKLPTSVKSRTAPIMTMPLRISRFLFFP